ncbi:YpiF family protein [Oceanobacillus sp. 1P07AA]|uniref:YpiF family protein n=1 Tax=Oceanobacillus sp. 1P07AA TaxID=3132293 RepID=UPI0039A4A0BA
MKWIREDINTYDGAKEFVDTLIIPLSPFQLVNTNEAKKLSSQYEEMNLMVKELEKELMGRVLLTPNYTYLKTTDKKAEVQRINQWTSHVKELPFEHVIFITFDPSWRKESQNLEGEVVWLPSIQLDSSNSNEIQRIIREQVGQTVELIRSFW